MKKIRNILAMLMVFVMLVAVMPMNVFADGEGEQNPAPAVTVTSIAIDTSSTCKTEYKVGDSLDVSGLKIKVTKSDNSEETVDVTSDMVTGFDSKNVTESQPLTITYQDKTATYNVKIAAATPAVTVTSIAIDTSSTYKTEYKVGDSLDVSGLKIKVTKSDNSEETVDVTSDMVTGFDSKNVTESQPLTITYQDKTATYNVKIAAATPAVTVTSIAIDTSSTYKTEYKVGDSLDVSGLKIKVTKSDNSEETVDVTSDMVTGFDSKNATESQPLTITYQDKTATYNISIKANEPEAKKFTLTAKVKGEGGKVSPESKKDIAANTKETVTITPNANYEIAEVKVNNEDKTKEVKNNELKLTMNENKDVVVTFKKKAEPKPETKEYTISKAYTNHGSFTVSKSKAKAGETITVTAKPYSGYAVARVYLEYNGIRKNINTYYNGYYYDGRYYGRYNDYNKYLDVYENSSYYLRKYDSYREFLRYEYPSHYRYYEDYDYWTDRYDYDWYNRYDNYYYKYFDDFRRSRYDTYEEYLRAEHYTHYRDYYNYRYDYNWYNRYGYTTTDTFEMPASNVTVYVEFTDAYPYYYDDYYYYRSRRDKEAEEAKAKKEAAKKEEEEAKAKAEAEKLPQVYENKAVIAIGSNVLDKVSKNVHTVHQMDTPAYVKNGRVMLPLRYVAEALGLQVSWVPETKTVIIWDLTQRVEIPVKSNRIIVNGITYTSDVKPEIKSSRTMLPIANIARALGLIDGSDIIWDQYNKQVTLTRKVLSK